MSRFIWLIKYNIHYVMFLHTLSAKAAVNIMVGSPCERGASERSATQSPSGNIEGFMDEISSFFRGTVPPRCPPLYIPFNKWSFNS